MSSGTETSNDFSLSSQTSTRMANWTNTEIMEGGTSESGNNSDNDNGILEYDGYEGDEYDP